MAAITGFDNKRRVGPIGLPGVTTTMTYSQARAGYFNVGRLTSVIGPGTGTPESTFTLDYDAAGREVVVNEPTSGKDLNDAIRRRA